MYSFFKNLSIAESMDLKFLSIYLLKCTNYVDLHILLVKLVPIYCCTLSTYTINPIKNCYFQKVMNDEPLIVEKIDANHIKMQ